MAELLDVHTLQIQRAFWNREQTSRPLFGCNVGFFMHQTYPTLVATLPKGLVKPEHIRVDLVLKDLEDLYQIHRQLDDDFPFVAVAFPYVPWMEAIMGCPVQNSGTSMWAETMIEDWSAWSWEQPSLQSNPWAQKLLELTEALVERSAGRYFVGATLMRGISDMLSAMRGARRFPLDCYDCPDVVHRAAELCAGVWVAVGKAQLDLLPCSPSGYVSGSFGLRAWAPDKLIWLQEDAMALLSPRIYRESFLPLDRRIAAEFPHSAFHLHGSALWSVNNLLASPEFDVIELNYDSGLCDADATFAAWKKIQMHKPLVVWKQFEGAEFGPWLDRVAGELAPRGLTLQIMVDKVEQARMVRAEILARWLDG